MEDSKEYCDEQNKDFREEYSNLLELARAAVPEYVQSVYGCYTSFYPRGQFFTIDFLKKENWPWNIADNSLFIKYKIGFVQQTIEVFKFGHIYLTDADCKKSYCVMASMKNYQKAYSECVEKAPWMRPIKYKTLEEGIKKLMKYIEYAHKTLVWCTEGYPYKKAIVDIY